MMYVFIVYVCMHMCMHPICIYTSVRWCVCVCVCLCACLLCMCVYVIIVHMYIYICMYVNIYVCVLHDNHTTGITQPVLLHNH